MNANVNDTILSIDFPTEENALTLINQLDILTLFSPQILEPKELIPPPRITDNGEIKPKRPQNAFFIFRQNVIKQAKSLGIKNMRLISKSASILWQRARPNEKDVYKEIAVKVSAVHRERYPGFRYTEDRSKLVFRHSSLPNRSVHNNHHHHHHINHHQHHHRSEETKLPESGQNCQVKQDKMQVKSQKPELDGKWGTFFRGLELAPNEPNSIDFTQLNEHSDYYTFEQWMNAHGCHNFNPYMNLSSNEHPGI
ncbi:hypothetical protein G9A89_008956 [Geosiphon pyriformis]|nr:hypothetical protein G9A89_008956 [Geosiphon pyriformis]